MSYSIRAHGGGNWIFCDEDPVLRLRGRNAAIIMRTAAQLDRHDSRLRLDWFLSGVVVGATYASMVRIGDAVAGPRVEPGPRIKSEDGEAA